jgi:hypothetical protein
MQGKCKDEVWGDGDSTMGVEPATGEGGDEAPVVTGDIIRNMRKT